MKTEGIDLAEAFVWLDDQPFESEKQVLAANGRADCLQIVDLRQPSELKRVMQVLVGNLG